MDISNINGISTGDIKSFFNNTSLTKTDKTDSFSDVLSAAMGSIGETYPRGFRIKSITASHKGTD